MDAEIKKADLKSAGREELNRVSISNTGGEGEDFIRRNLSYEVLNTSMYQLSDWVIGKEDTMIDAPLLIDFRDANLARDLNSHFSDINKRIVENGLYVGCFESNYNWKVKLVRKYNRGLAYFILVLNYIFRNVVPGWKYIKNRDQYFINSLYQDNSLAEVLGRLVFCGFEIINYNEYDNITYFVVRKKTAPRTDMVSTSRFIVRLNRVGKGGKIIKIYKVRTMYPFSEFIQDYVVKINGYDAIGKPKNDFRLTSCGKIIRKLWIDELPQLVNLIKGDIRIVGVRPISRYGFSSLPKDLQEKRIRYKPGLIPPSASLRIKGFKGVIQAEMKYLEEKEKNPLKTDIRYFFLAIINIITFRVKSS